MGATGAIAVDPAVGATVELVPGAETMAWDELSGEAGVGATVGATGTGVVTGVGVETGTTGAGVGVGVTEGVGVLVDAGVALPPEVD